LGLEKIRLVSSAKRVGLELYRTIFGKSSN